MTHSPNDENKTAAGFARYLPVVTLHALVLLLGVVMLWEPTQWGRDDWDYFAHHYEAMRRTVIEYHQIPWWNPWSCGGIPLATNPQLGLLSINFLFVLLIGTYPGLKLAMLLHLIVAAEGARWLARAVTQDGWARAIMGFVYVANGSVSLYVASGHLGIELIAWIPWAIGLALRLEQDPRWGFALGVVVAAAALTSFQYFLVYLALVLVVQFVWRLWASDRNGRRNLLLGCFSAVTVYLAVAGMRTVLAAELVLDFPRGRFSIITQRITPDVLVAMLLWPRQHSEFRLPDWFGNYGLGWHEFGCYVGVIVCLLFVASLKGGWRWWHSLAVLCFWLALGNNRWYLPSTWLTQVPVLKTLRLASRWRVIGVLGIALGCGAAVSQWTTSRRRWVRIAAGVTTAFVFVDLTLNAIPIYRSIFVNAPQVIAREPADRDFVQLETLPISPKSGTQMLAMIRANYGVVYSYEPLLGQDYDPYSARLWRGHPDYRGEYCSDDGPVELLRWSPNAITLRTASNAEVAVNQNPGSYWHVNGRSAFSLSRSTDRHGPFLVRADERGRVELTIWPRSWPLGAWVTGAGFVAVLLAHYLNQKLHGRNGQNQQHVRP